MSTKGRIAACETQTTAREAEEERLLAGGIANRGHVMRVGETVRRPGWRATGIEALLEHLDGVGFDEAPKHLGHDDSGREVLRYIPGEAALDPLPEWALTDESLVSVAGLLRRYHDAVQSFDPSSYSWATAVPARYRGGLVCHNDPNLDNVIFREGRAVALIDFDLASPGCRLWDVALAARLWVPLRAPEDVHDERGDRALPRLRVFLDAYGLPHADRHGILDAVASSLDWCYAIVAAGAARHVGGYDEYWSTENQRRVERARRWLRAGPFDASSVG